MVTPTKHARHRARDEQLLGWVKLRARGQTAAAIAERLGLTRSAVLLATKEIKDADIAESGKPEAVVAAAYWRGK